ncbi:MAG: hypothetical protein Q8M37_02430 [Nevskia sp.]|nr:hypothetical protein [Nevskia sp.]
MTGPQALHPTRLAPIPAAFASGSLVGGSRSSCGQLVGKVQSKQKKRLGDIPVRVQ